MAASIHLTKFQGAKKPQGRSSKIEWSDLVAMFTTPAVFESKAEMPLFSCTEFKKNYRSEENAGQVYAIVGDHDSGQMYIEDCAEIMRANGIACVISSTASHTWDNPRFRIVVRLSEPTDAAGHRHYVRLINHLLTGALAPESELSYQSWFYGKMIGVDYECIEIEGEPIDIAEGVQFDSDERACGKKRQEKSRDVDVDDMFDDSDFVKGEPPTPASAERIREMLASSGANPDGSRDEWRDVVFMIHSSQHPDAEDIAREWSQQSGQYDEDDFDALWKSIKHERHSRLTLGTLHKMATDNGWQDPKIVPAAEMETFGDISNGRRFATKHRGEFLYVHALAKWLQWDGLRWKRCDGDEAMAAAKVISVEALDAATEILKEDSSERNKSNWNHALSVHRNGKRLETLLKMAWSEPGMSITDPSKLDADPWLLGVKNGVLNLRSGKLIDAKPAMLITKQAAAAFRPGAKCPRWRQFMHDIFNDNEDIINFVQRSVGYAVTGLVDEEIMFFLLGKGANGKSVFANILHGVFAEYAITVRSTMLAREAHGNAGEAEREKMKLPGARLALINEVSVNDVFDDQKLKELVSREMIGARALYKESFEFTPSHTIFLRGNHRPGAMDAGDGFWRRIALIQFKRQFAEHEKVPDLDRQILNEERDGILNWILEGCLSWQKIGLAMPAEIKRDGDRYRRDSDPIGEWLDTCCTADDGFSTLAALYSSYERDAKVAGIRPMARLKLSKELETRGFMKVRKKSGQIHEGLTLKDIDWDVSTDEEM